MYHIQSVSVSLDIAKFDDFWWKNADASRTQEVLIYFLNLLYVRYNCAKFHHCKTWVTGFKKGALIGPPYPWAIPKGPILNRVTATCHANPGPERNFEGRNSYILRYIYFNKFLKFPNTSANNNVLVWTN